MSDYTLRRSGGSLPTVTASLADWGVREDSVRLDFTTRAQDRMTFALDAAFDAADTFPFGVTVELLRDGAVVFLGRVTSMPRTGSDGAESLAVECAGPWWYLDHLVYEQLWTVPDTSDGAALGATLTKPLTRIIIGRDLGAAKITAAAFIAEVFAFLADKIPSAPVSLGDIHASLASEIPTEEARDLTVGEAILRVLRWYPDIEPAWDLSPGHATLHFRRRGDLRLALDPAVAPVRDITLKARPDLRPSCVLIRYQRSSEQGGDAGVEIIEDKWPLDANEYALDALRLVVELEGGSGQVVTQYIRVENIAVQYPTWWARHLPALKSDKVTELAVVTGSSSVTRDEDAAEDAVVYTREILDGALPWWKTYRETPVVCAAKLTYKVTLDSGAVEERTEEARIRIRSTDAETGNYAYAGDYRAPEPAPEGLARRYYEALSSLVHEGSLTHDPGEWDGVSRVGQALDLPGFAARPDWASLGAPIVGHTVELSAGRSTYTLGPAKHLAPDDWVSLARPARGIAHATRPVATQRATGRYKPAAASGSSGGSPATPAVSPTAGAPRATPSVISLTPSGVASATSSAGDHPWRVAALKLDGDSFAVPYVTLGAVDRWPASDKIHDATGITSGYVPTQAGLGPYSDLVAEVGKRVRLPLPALAALPNGINRSTWYSVYVFARDGAIVPPQIYVVRSDAEWSDPDFWSDSYRVADFRHTRASSASGGAHSYEIYQYETGNIERAAFHAFRVQVAARTLWSDAPADGILANTADLRILVWPGRLKMAVADVASASGFNDDSSYAGQKSFELKAYEWDVVNQGSDLSVWFSSEFPYVGRFGSPAQISANRLILQLTPTSAMPANCPWVVVARKSTKAEGARADDPAVKTSENNNKGDGGQLAPGAAKTLAQAQAEIAAAAPGEYDRAEMTMSNSGLLTKDLGVAIMSYSVGAITTKWFKTVDGQEVQVRAATSRYDTYCKITNKYPEITALGASYSGDGIGNKENQPGGVQYPYEWTDYYSGSRMVTPLGVILPSPDGDVYNYGGGATWYYFLQKIRSVRASYNGPITILSNTYSYLKIIGGSGETSSSDTGWSGDRPKPPKGRPKRGEDKKGPQAADADVTAAKDANGNPIKGPGSGLWVYEIARIHADTGWLEQRISSDIVLHPAPQVQLRDE